LASTVWLMFVEQQFHGRLGVDLRRPLTPGGIEP
jgi:hypothetical protein